MQLRNGAGPRWKMGMKQDREKFGDGAELRRMLVMALDREESCRWGWTQKKARDDAGLRRKSGMVLD